MNTYRLLSISVLLTGSALSMNAAQPANNNSGREIPGSYIVTLKGDAQGDDVIREHGVAAEHVFTHAMRGFAGPLAAGKLKALRADRRVASIEPDRVVSLIHPVQPESVSPTVVVSTVETLPTGVNRIDAELHPRTNVSGVAIAVIDTGIWQKHEDLSVAGGYNCISKKTTAWNDDNGHGTHVAGIAAAKANNGLGVRGVAPSAKLYAVKVLDYTGSGQLSWIIKGVDWVTANAVSKNIRVANMSLGFVGTSTALNTSISNSVKAGVTFVVAAGNSATDSSSFSPANHPLVIAVSAIADSNGTCGAGGVATPYGADDTFATFSNWGAPVALAAPGVNIFSTWLGSSVAPAGTYATLSGTSMAAPHVTGAAVQYIAGHLTAKPADVRTVLILNGVPQSLGCIGNTGSGGFSGDPDHAAGDIGVLVEPLVYVPNL